MSGIAPPTLAVGGVVWRDSGTVWQIVDSGCCCSRLGGRRDIHNDIDNDIDNDIAVAWLAATAGGF